MWSKIGYIARGRTLPQVWKIPLVVGSLLTVGNQSEALLSGDLRSLGFPVLFNFLTPYVVSSLGYLKTASCDGLQIVVAASDLERQDQTPVAI